jgi:elongation factor P--beta-lysine ligase
VIKLKLDELKELYQILQEINERALDDDEFNDLLSEVFNENVEEQISRLHSVLEENSYF